MVLVSPVLGLAHPAEEALQASQQKRPILIYRRQTALSSCSSLEPNNQVRKGEKVVWDVKGETRYATFAQRWTKGRSLGSWGLVVKGLVE